MGSYNYQYNPVSGRLDLTASQAQSIPDSELTTYHFNDFMVSPVSPTAAAIDHLVAGAAVGTGANVTNVNPIPTTIGLLQLRVGTPTSGTSARFFTGSRPIYRTTACRFSFQTRIKLVNTFDALTQNYKVYLGFIDSAVAPSTTGCWIELNNDLNGNINWWAVASDSGISTKVDTGVAIQHLTLDKFEIVITAADVTYFINDTLVATINTNLPIINTISRNFGFGVTIFKDNNSLIGNVSTADVHCDYYRVHLINNLLRT